MYFDAANNVIRDTFTLNKTALVGFEKFETNVVSFVE